MRETTLISQCKNVEFDVSGDLTASAARKWLRSTRDAGHATAPPRRRSSTWARSAPEQHPGHFCVPALESLTLAAHWSLTTHCSGDDVPFFHGPDQRVVAEFGFRSATRFSGAIQTSGDGLSRTGTASVLAAHSNVLESDSAAVGSVKGCCTTVMNY